MRKAVWFYMPSTDHGFTSACDDCVPRGCDCNLEPVDGNWESEDPDNWKHTVDEDGREYPCCEWWKDCDD